MGKEGFCLSIYIYIYIHSIHCCSYYIWRKTTKKRGEKGAKLHTFNHPSRIWHNRDYKLTALAFALNGIDFCSGCRQFISAVLLKMDANMVLRYNSETNNGWEMGSRICSLARARIHSSAARLSSGDPSKQMEGRVDGEGGQRGGADGSREFTAYWSGPPPPFTIPYLYPATSR